MPGTDTGKPVYNLGYPWAKFPGAQIESEFRVIRVFFVIVITKTQLVPSATLQ